MGVYHPENESDSVDCDIIIVTLGETHSALVLNCAWLCEYTSSIYKL